MPNLCTKVGQLRVMHGFDVSMETIDFLQRLGIYEEDGELNDLLGSQHAALLASWFKVQDEVTPQVGDQWSCYVGKTGSLQK